MDIKAISQPEFLALTKQTAVISFAIGFDVSGEAIVLKLRFRSRLIKTLHIQAEDALRVFVRLKQNGEQFGWTAKQPREILPLTPADWDGARSLTPASFARVDVFSDAVLIAAHLGEDLFQAFRLPPEYAQAIAEEVLDARDRGALHDARTQQPTTATRQ